MFINKPKRGTYEPSRTDTDKESNYKVQIMENPKVTRKDLKAIIGTFLPLERSEI